MSIGFQKKQGVGTTAYDQLTKLGELITNVQQLNFPEIYKKAKMFAGNNALVPIIQNWSLEGFNQSYILNLNGRFFGSFFIQHTHNGIGDVPAEQSEFRIFDGNDETFYCLAGKYTDGTHFRNTKEYNFEGFGTSISLFKPRSLGVNFYHKVRIYFVGFQLGAALPDAPVPTPLPTPVPAPPDVNVNITINSRPNGVQKFTALFGTLNILQPNGSQNYNVIATNIKLNGFEGGLKFSYKYYLDGVLNLQGADITTASIDVFHSHKHEIIIDYVIPVLNVQTFIKMDYVAHNTKIVRDDGTSEILTANYKLLNYPTTTLQFFDDVLVPLGVGVYKLRNDVITYFLNNQTSPTPAISVIDGDKILLFHQGGAQVAFFNYTNDIVNINAVPIASNSLSRSTGAENDVYTVNNPTLVAIKLAARTNGINTYYTLAPGASQNFTLTGTPSNDLVVMIY